MSSRHSSNTNRFAWLTLPVILATTVLMTLNTAIVNVALGAVRDSLGFSPASISWVINGYLLTYGGFLIVGGRLGDLVGRRRTMLIGIAVFTIASVSAAIAWTPSLLVASRALQGIGAALSAPAVLAIITHLYEGESRTKAIGWFSVVVGVALSMGMILGGVILHWWGWRGIFWVNVPFGVLLFGMTAWFVPPMSPERRSRIDGIGAVLITSVTIAIVYALVALAASVTSHRTPLAGLISMGFAVLGFLALAMHLRSTTEPLIPLASFSQPTVVGAFSASALQAAALSSMIFFMSQWFGSQLGLHPVEIGAMFLLFTVPQLGTAIAARRLNRRFGVRRMVIACLFLAATGMLLLADAVTVQRITPQLVIGMFLAGAGCGAVYLGLNITIMSVISADIAGVASGVLQTTVQLGASIGIALLVLVSVLAGISGALFGGALLLLAGVMALAIGRQFSKTRSRTASATR